MSETATESTPYLTADEARAYLRLPHTEQVEALYGQGKIRGADIDGMVYFKRADLDKFFELAAERRSTVTGRSVRVEQLDEDGLERMVCSHLLGTHSDLEQTIERVAREQYVEDTERAGAIVQCPGYVDVSEDLVELGNVNGPLALYRWTLADDGETVQLESVELDKVPA